MNTTNTCIAINCPDFYREKSASGGVFPYIAEHVVNAGGYVSGAIYNNTFTGVYHTIASQWSEIQPMRSSKYVQSHASLAFRKIAQLLNQNKIVLFTGCACQCAALKKYLKDKAPLDKLLTLDIICYGTPDPKVYSSYINSLIEQHGPVQEVDFRKKSHFGWNCGLYIKFINGHIHSCGSSDPYLKGFLDGYIMCKGCHKCKFKTNKYSDLTIGDFWGIEEIDPSLSDKKGTSLIEINTEKGQKLFDEIFKNVSTQSTQPITYAIKNNLALRYSLPEHPFRKTFFKLFNARKNDLDFWEFIKKTAVF